MRYIAYLDNVGYAATTIRSTAVAISSVSLNITRGRGSDRPGYGCIQGSECNPQAWLEALEDKRNVGTKAVNEGY